MPSALFTRPRFCAGSVNTLVLFKLKVFLLPHCAGERAGGFLVLILQGRILVGLVLSNSRYASVQVASSFIPCLHLLIYVEETQSITLGQKLFLLWVLNVNLGMSLALRKVPFKLRVPEWLLFASSVWRDVISAVPIICHLFLLLFRVTADFKLFLLLLLLEGRFCREDE